MTIAKTPPPPYYAVIFTSFKTADDNGYSAMADAMEALAVRQSGYLGHESVRDGMGITISYWDSLESVKQWKANESHLVAQSKGKTDWYQSYKVRICKVERDYNFEK